MDQWLNAGDGPIDGWSGKKLGKSSGDRTRQALEVIDLTGKIDGRENSHGRCPRDSGRSSALAPRPSMGTSMTWI